MSQIRFSALTEQEIHLLTAWLRQPHVLEYWPEHMTDHQIRQKYLKHIASDTVFPYIIWDSEVPIGYIQAYVANRIGGGWWPNVEENSYGIDLFIGEREYVDKRYGSKILRLFMTDLSTKHRVRKWIADINPENYRAIRCFEKAGFSFIKEIDTPDGRANLMEVLAG